MPTIKESLIKATKQLDITNHSASLEAEILLAKVLNKSKEYILSYPQHKLTLLQSWQYQRLISKRLKGIPVAYLTNTKEFYGYQYMVNKDTLIPRPESELFIDEFKKIKPENKTILDIGTGSGCLIITAALLFPNNNFIGTDISSQALKIAKQNSKIHRTQIDFLQGNLLLPANKKRIDIIFANLPYLTNNEMFEPSIKLEPKKALYGGKNGLELYKKLFQQISKQFSLTPLIFLEINPQQEQKLKDLISKYLPKARIKTIQDLNNQSRLVKIYC